MIRRRGKLVRYGEVWFDEEPEPPWPDIMIYRQRPMPLPGAQCTPFSSLVSDLAPGEQLMWERIDKDCRYDIRRAEKDGVLPVLEPAPSPASIAEFEEFFGEFAADKSLGPLDRDWIAAATAAGQLFLSSARYNDEVLVWHSHVVSGTSLRLLHSCSLRRESDSRKRQLVGRANRLLHWRDMCEFRRLGFGIYDWGGMFTDESVATQKKINDFKREFGGEGRIYFDCILSLTALGRLYLPVRSALRKTFLGEAELPRTFVHRAA